MENKEEIVEILRRLEKGKEAFVEAKYYFKTKRYSEGLEMLSKGIYQTARALLLMKNIQENDYSKVIRLFGIHYVHSGILEPKEVKDALVFASFKNDSQKDFDMKTFDIKEIKKNINYFIKIIKSLQRKLKLYKS